MSYKFVTHIASVNRHSVWENKYIEKEEQKYKKGSDNKKGCIFFYQCTRCSLPAMNTSKPPI